jgi:ribosomal protein L11 methyltransferase
LNYTAYHITVSADYADILIAELAELGYDTFEDTDSGFSAYIPENQIDESAIKDLLHQYQNQFSIAYHKEEIEDKNWNAIWEAAYQPVIIADRCLIRSSFHQIQTKYPYEILINPKMSFGTGHHNTTTLMIEHQLEINHTQKRILDAGCGTAVLAIMAKKLGATHIEAYDIDEWAVSNSLENVALNDSQDIVIWQGDVNSVPAAHQYDIILANIQRNVLLAEMPQYAAHLVPEGEILLSGFYEVDIPVILATAQREGLQEINRKIKESWTALRLRKVHR